MTLYFTKNIIILQKEFALKCILKGKLKTLLTQNTVKLKTLSQENSKHCLKKYWSSMKDAVYSVQGENHAKKADESSTVISDSPTNVQASVLDPEHWRCLVRKVRLNATKEGGVGVLSLFGAT